MSFTRATVAAGEEEAAAAIAVLRTESGEGAEIAGEEDCDVDVDVGDESDRARRGSLAGSALAAVTALTIATCRDVSRREASMCLLLAALACVRGEAEMERMRLELRPTMKNTHTHTPTEQREECLCSDFVDDDEGKHPSIVQYKACISFLFFPPCFSLYRQNGRSRIVTCSVDHARRQPRLI